MARRGFTLIELLVVIAIVALLIGIELPALGAARERARSVVALSAARQIATAELLYADDHDDRLLPSKLPFTEPDGSPLVIDGPAGEELGGIVATRWLFRLGPYFSHAYADVTHVGEQRAVAVDFDEVGDTALSTSRPYAMSVEPSFGINEWHVGGVIGADHRPVRRAPECLLRLSRAFRTETLIAFASARRAFSFNGSETAGYEAVYPLFSAPFDEASDSIRFGHVDLRYGGEAVVATLDGRGVSLDEFEVTDLRRWSDAASRAGLAAADD